MSKMLETAPPARCRRLEVQDSDWQAVGREDLVRMLALLHLIRAFERRVLDLHSAGLVHGPAHLCVGQEAAAAAVAVALRPSDFIASTHRAHGHFVAKAVMHYAPADYRPLETPVIPAMQTAVNRTLAEIMGLRDGWCGGRGGSMHLYDGASGNLGSNAIVGGGIPIATGVAWAQRFLQKDNVVVSFFGDGAINQGCFHEVANMAALWAVPILYLVENNLYAVGTSTGQSSCVRDLAQRSVGYGFDSLIVDGMDPLGVYLAVRDSVAAIRAKPFPSLIEAKTYRFYHHGGGLAGSAFGYRSQDEEAAWAQRDPVLAFPTNLERHGLILPEENKRLQELATEMVESATEVCTQRDGEKRTIRAVKWPDPETLRKHVRCERNELAQACYAEREDFSSFQPMTYVEAITKVTLRSMERDPRVIVLGEEVANLRGGAYGATKGIKEVFPDRLINTPISETGFVGMAGGLAAAGLRPVVEIMFPDFALMASDQLFNQIGKLGHMYCGQVCFPLILRTRVAIGYGYGGQHSMDPCGFFAQFAGWRILAAADAYDYVGLFNTAMKLHDPVLIVEHGKLYGETCPVPKDDLDYCIPYGRARVVRRGNDVTVLTYLSGVKQCLQAAEDLAREGIEAEVIDLRTLDYAGMDWETIGSSLAKTGSVLTVEQAPRSQSLGGRIASEIQARFFDDLDGPIGALAGLDVPSPVSRKLEEAVVPSTPQIKERMARTARRQN